MTWTPEKISELATGYWASQALLAAVEVGLFEALPAPATEACARAGIDPRVGEMLLDALVAIGLVVRNGETYAVDPSAAPSLSARSPVSMVGALRFNSAMYAMWGKLGDAVKTGQPVVPPGGHLGADPARTRGFVMGMHSRALALLPPVAAAIDLGNATTLLDVGSGAGTLGRMLAEKNPDLRVTLLDLPAITDVARELTAAHPTAARATHLAANYLTAPLPSPYDAVLHCGALHQHSAADATALIARLTAATHPGGRVVVVDLLAGPAFSMLFALNMALISPQSRMHSPAEVRQYFLAAGLDDVRDHSVGALYHLVSGARR